MSTNVDKYRFVLRLRVRPVADDARGLSMMSVSLDETVERKESDYLAFIRVALSHRSPSIYLPLPRSPLSFFAFHLLFPSRRFVSSQRMWMRARTKFSAVRAQRANGSSRPSPPTPLFVLLLFRGKTRVDCREFGEQMSGSLRRVSKIPALHRNIPQEREKVLVLSLSLSLSLSPSEFNFNFGESLTRKRVVVAFRLFSDVHFRSLGEL